MSKIEIEHVQITPASTTAKGTIKIIMDVSDRNVTYTNDKNYAGELYAGQQIGDM